MERHNRSITVKIRLENKAMMTKLFELKKTNLFTIMVI